MESDSFYSGFTAGSILTLLGCLLATLIYLFYFNRKWDKDDEDETKKQKAEETKKEIKV